MMDIKTDYEALAKKYKLPSYEDLDENFEILYVGTITEIKYPLRFIRRRINDKLAFFCSLLQGLLQPNPGSLVNLQESKFLDEAEHKKIMKLLKELMFIERQSLLLDINPSEKEEADFIKETFKEWNTIKKEVETIFTKVKDAWKKEIEKKKGESYFG